MKLYVSRNCQIRQPHTSDMYMYQVIDFALTNCFTISDSGSTSPVVRHFLSVIKKSGIRDFDNDDRVRRHGTDDDLYCSKCKFAALLEAKINFLTDPSSNQCEEI